MAAKATYNSYSYKLVLLDPPSVFTYAAIAVTMSELS